MTADQQTALLHAAQNVLWKLSHNHKTPDYSGPGRITREDATVRMLQDAVNAIAADTLWPTTTTREV